VTARRLSCSGVNFVFLAIGWVGFDSIVLQPTFHSCTHIFFKLFDFKPSIHTQAKHSIHLTNAQLNLRHEFTTQAMLLIFSLAHSMMHKG